MLCDQGFERHAGVNAPAGSERPPSFNGAFKMTLHNLLRKLISSEELFVKYQTYKMSGSGDASFFELLLK